MVGINNAAAPEQKNSANRLHGTVDVRRLNRRHKPKMSTNDQTKLRKIVDRLRVVLDELSELEKTRGDPALKQAALSAAMALAWIDLVDSLPTNNG